MNYKNRRSKEKQYAIEATATFVVIAHSLKEAKQAVEDELYRQNTIDVTIVNGQALVPQISIDDDEA